MRLIIAGSRHICDARLVWEGVADFAREHWVPTEIVSGGAWGADQLGENWARFVGLPCTVFPANWKPNGVFDRAAGFKRNAQMGDYADGLVAVWDGLSKGTGHMIDCMFRLRKPVVIVKLY